MFLRYVLAPLSAPAPNRTLSLIPLLTQVSKRRINWSSYKIRQHQDKIGVFVSLVATKVPFKGTQLVYEMDLPDKLEGTDGTAAQGVRQARLKGGARPPL